MKISIETYRDHEIYFDTEANSFIAITDRWDRQFEKKSFAAAKKEIDDFIKDNLQFEPVWVEKESFRMYGTEKKVKLIGLRKDGMFMYEDGNEKRQISKYDIKDYFISNKKNEYVYSEIYKMEEKIDIINAEITELRKGIIKDDLGLNELKRKYSLLIN